MTFSWKKERRLLKFYILWYSLKKFRLPPKITRMTIIKNVLGMTELMVYFRVGKDKRVYYTQFSFFSTIDNIPNAISSAAKAILKRIETKEIYLKVY